MKFTFDVRHFDELAARELYDVLHLRDVVFVVGQKITAVPEVDGLDPACHHARIFADGRLAGTARLFADRDPTVVGRVAVHPEFQRRGVGTEMMKRVQDWLGDRPAELHAQAYLEDWYRALGWRRIGEVYQEAEIDHVTMIRP